MLTVVVVMVTFATVGSVSAVGNMTGYWQYPDSNQALGESVRSVLVSEGRMIFGAGDIGATGSLPSGGTFGIASYDGTTWSDIAGTGVEARSGCSVYSGRPSVQVVAGTASDLYVAGEFSHINGVNAFMIARRTGGTWSALGQGLCYLDAGGDYWQMGDILVDGSDVYVTGSFRAANPWDNTISDYALYLNGIGKWNGSTWSALGGGMSGSSHPKYGRAIEKDPDNNVIYVGGAFDSVNASYNRATQVWGGAVSGTAGIACWNPGTSTWSSIGAGLASSDDVNAMVYSNGALYVGGNFSSIGGVTTKFVAKFTPTGACTGTWSAVGTGGLTSSVIGSGSTELCATEANASNGVWSMIKDPAGSIYVGCTPDDLYSPGVLKWTGSDWTTVSQSRSGTNGVGRSVGRTRALALFDDRLWAAGSWYVSEGGSSGLVKFSTALDLTPPTVSSFTSSQSSPTSASSFTYTLTFSESVTGVASGDFTNSGTATGCTFSPGTDSGATRTVTVSGCDPGTVVPVFAANGALDTSSNQGPPTPATAGTTITVQDVTAPTVTLTSATINPAQSATVRSTETGTAYLVKSTVNVTNLASITGAAGNLWNSATISAANTDVSLAATGLVSGTYKLYAVDASGNLSSPSTNSVTVLADNPYVTITRSGTGTIGAGQDTTLTFTLSETSVNFSVADVTVSGGTMSNFAGSGTVYTATWTPPASGSGTATVSVGANKFTDAAGNQNTASDSFSIAWNTIPASTCTLAPSGASSGAPGGTSPATLVGTTPGSSGSTATSSPTTTTKPSPTTTTKPSVTTTTTPPSDDDATDPQVTAAARENATTTPRRAPEIGADGAVVLVDDSEIEATVTRSATEYIVEAGDLSARLGMRDANGTPTELDSSGRLRAKPDGQVGIGVDGFAGATPVVVWMFSDPVNVGRATTGTDGAVTSQFSLARDTPAGTHTVVLVGTDPRGRKVTVAVGLVIEEKAADADSGAPPTAEGEPSEGINQWLIGVPIVLAVFVALFIPARRRRREEENEVPETTDAP